MTEVKERVKLHFWEKENYRENRRFLMVLEKSGLLEKYLRRLPENMDQVLCWRFGLMGNIPWTFEDMEKRMGVGTLSTIMTMCSKGINLLKAMAEEPE